MIALSIYGIGVVVKPYLILVHRTPMPKSFQAQKTY